MPVVTQLDEFLSSHSNTFKSDDLILVLAGANDVFFQFGGFAATVGAGGDAATAQATAIAAVRTAATELSLEVKQRILARGARRVAVLNVPDLGTFPLASGLPAPSVALLTALSQEFNTQLAAELAESQALLLDFSAGLKAIRASKMTNGIADDSHPACDSAKISLPPEAGTAFSLMCTDSTLVAANARNTYFWADDAHPSSLGHKLIGDWVVAQLVAKLPH